MPWVNTTTGASSNASPDWTGGSYSNTQWVDPAPAPTSDPFGTYGSTNQTNSNSNHVAPSWGASHSTQTTSGSYSGPYVPSAAEVFFWNAVKFLFVGGLILAVLGLIGYRVYADLNLRFTPKYTTVGGTTYYTADEIARFNYLPWNHGDWLQLRGQNIVVTGTLRDAQMRAPGNITLQGDVIHSAVRADNGMLRAANVTNSALTADDIQVTGKTVNTRQWIEGYYFSHGKKTNQRARPIPRPGL